MSSILPNPTRTLSAIRHVSLDMDGTIYKGDYLFPYTVDFLARLDDLGIGYTFLTNNSSKSVDAYLVHLRKMGIETTREKVYTSSLATIDYLRLHHPDVRRVFVLGTPSLKQEMADYDYMVVQGDDEPEAVVVGFDTALDYERLCKCAWWIAQGKPYLATHPDAVCPTNQPTVLVDCGAICACLQTATGRQPDAVPGKPDPAMLQGIMRRYDIQPHEMAMVGDRIYTDVAMAHNANAVGVLVLTGEATAHDAAISDQPPHFVMESIEELGRRLAESRQA